MANREALRELQTRLASRLQAARTEGVSISWLAVKAGEANYLFPLALSGEIFPLTTVQVVPSHEGRPLKVLQPCPGQHSMRCAPQPTSALCSTQKSPALGQSLALVQVGQPPACACRAVTPKPTKTSTTTSIQVRMAG